MVAGLTAINSSELGTDMVAFHDWLQSLIDSSAPTVGDEVLDAPEADVFKALMDKLHSKKYSTLFSVIRATALPAEAAPVHRRRQSPENFGTVLDEKRAGRHAQCE